jgi:acyl-CoA hydrolase
MVPADANFMGNIFGGTILAEVDRVAFVTATRHAGGNCVTASFDRVDFIAPVHVGDLAEFVATVTFVGRSAMEVWVEVRAEDLRGGPSRLVGNAFVTMVALDDDGRPRSIPTLTLTNDAERKRFQNGERRMAVRRETRAKGPAASARS